MKISKVSVLAVVVVMAMVFCSFVPAVNCAAVSEEQSGTQTDKETFKYVSLGDSMTAGYGLFGYYPEGELPNQLGFLMDVESTYPYKITKYLEGILGEEYDVQHAQLAMSSTRSIELRTMIDDTFIGRTGNPGDLHTTGLFSESKVKTLSDAAAKKYPALAQEYSGFELLQQVYRTELADADLITYNMHYDFGYALSGKIEEIAAGGPGIDTDFTLYYEAEYVEMAKNIEQTLMAYLINYLAEQGIDAKAIVELAEKILRAAVYAVVSYCANFDALMEYIFTNNPDAKVIVIDTYNMFESLDLVVSDITVSLSEFYQYLLDISNFYAQYSSPYALYCYHLNLDQPMILGHEFKYLDGDQLSKDAKAGVIFAMGQANPDKPAQESSVLLFDYMDGVGNGNFSKFLKCIFRSTVINGTELIGQDISVLIATLGTKMAAAVALTMNPATTVTYNPEDGSCVVSLAEVNYTFTKYELSLLWLYLFSLSGDGILAHPSAYGHDYITEQIEAIILEEEILVEGSRVYITEDDIAKASDGPALEDTGLLYNYAVRGVRGSVNFIYLNWDEIIDFINSDDYVAVYQEIQGAYATWQQYYKSGGLDAGLEELHTKLIYVDANWDTIFAGYTEEEIVKQLHLYLQVALLNWDSVKAMVGEYAVMFDQAFAQVVVFLAPETIRPIVNDPAFSVLAREYLLNFSFCCDAMIGELFQKLMTAETPEQAMLYFTEVMLKYTRPCHEARLVEAIEPTCETDGCVEHYDCKICTKMFIQDEFGKYSEATEEEVVIPGGHTLITHEAVKATCQHTGNNLYYTCENCDVVLKADKVTETTVQAETLPVTDHHHEKIPGVTPTKTEVGYTEGDMCVDCKTVFVQPKEIPATGSDQSTVTTTTSTAEFYVPDSGEIKSLSVKFDGTTTGVKSEIKIPTESISALKGKTIEFSVNKASGQSDTYVIDMTVDGSAYSGETYISIPYEASKGIPAVKWVEGGSSMEVVSTDSSAGLVTFKTTHNSSYQVTYSPAASSDNTMTIVIVAIVAVLAVLAIGGVIIWKKRGSA